MTNVRVGSVVFNGGAGQDGFYIRALKGLGGVGVRSDSVPRPQAHGEFDVPVFRTARVVSMEGPCISGSAEVMQHREDMFTAILSEGQSGQVVFDMPGGPRWGMARLADTPEFDPEIWGQRSQYLIQFKFANPRLFGSSKSFASGESAYHYGNFPATPVFTVSGTMSGYTINGPGGKKFTVTAAVTAGNPHTIDMATGLLTVGGVTVFGAVSRADTWAIAGGAQVVNTLVPLTGSGTLAAKVTDTFL